VALSCYGLVLSAVAPASVGVTAVRASASPPGFARGPQLEEGRGGSRAEPSPASAPAVVMEDPRPPRPSSGPTRHDPAAIRAIIRNAFVEAGQDPEAAIRVAMCESSLREDAIGDGGDAVGLFQWHIGPWLQHSRRLFRRDVGDLRADPVMASLVTASTVQLQGWGIWTCQP
jgi:hypothetical protein